MSDSPSSTLLLLGLAGTGKTNFLVALDVVLDDQSHVDGLVHSEKAEDRTYLQPLKEKWLRGEVLEHTSRQQPPPPHQLLVRHPATGTFAGLHLPDLAGETFDAHFVTRSFPQEFCDRLQHAPGLLLFLHCDHNGDHAILENTGLMEPTPTQEAYSVISSNKPAKDWELEDAAQQVKLVDLMQFIAETKPWQGHLRVAVIISAWDLVENAPSLGPRSNAQIPNDPTKFFSIHWPLLDQYLLSHKDIFCFRIFGVSARGGGTSATDIARLTNLDRPCDRIIVVDDVQRSNDLTRPVRWLLGLLNTETTSDV